MSVQYYLESAYAHGVNRYYSYVEPWFYPFRGDEKALGIMSRAVTSKVTAHGNIGNPSSGVKGGRGGREWQEEERMVSKLCNTTLLQNRLHPCYKVLVQSLIAEIATHCTLLTLCSEWEAGTWFVKCRALTSSSCSQGVLGFDPLKHCKTGSNSHSEAVGILPARPSPACWRSLWSQPHHAGVLPG